MFNITRWDPFRELVDMRRTMDRLMEGAVLGPEGMRQQLGMPLDVSENQDAYKIEASMPGIKPEDVEITLDGNTLTIRGQIKAEEEREGETFHLRERREGSFVRSINLPGNVKADAVEANYDNGVLKLLLPKTEETKPKRIQIQSGKA